MSLRMDDPGVARRPLGATGLDVPEVGMGTAEYIGGTLPLVKGLDLGAGLIDTAESYGTEYQISKAIVGRREEVIIASKVSAENLRPEEVRKSCEMSCRRLGTDYIDLYQIHWPNPEIPLAETLGALNELVDSGQIRWIGVCNFSVKLLKEARVLSSHPIVSNQVPYSLVDRSIEDELLPYCQAEQITVIAYSPLSGGLYRLEAGLAPGALLSVVEESDHTPAQVALNWCLRQPDVVVIPKSRRASRIVENCGASGWSLTPDQIASLGPLS